MGGSMSSQRLLSAIEASSNDGREEGVLPLEGKQSGNSSKHVLFKEEFKRPASEDLEKLDDLDLLTVNNCGKPFMGNGLFSVDEIDRLLEDGNASDISAGRNNMLPPSTTHI